MYLAECIFSRQHRPQHGCRWRYMYAKGTNRFAMSNIAAVFLVVPVTQKYILSGVMDYDRVSGVIIWTSWWVTGGIQGALILENVTPQIRHLLPRISTGCRNALRRRLISWGYLKKIKAGDGRESPGYFPSRRTTAVVRRKIKKTKTKLHRMRNCGRTNVLHTYSFLET